MSVYPYDLFIMRRSVRRATNGASRDTIRRGERIAMDCLEHGRSRAESITAGTAYIRRTVRERSRGDAA
ncbi:hypothetical protein EO087_01715 [Dyella sp. M7H15-1]|uniref:hypothetical protein n=1 Tax=Dyella sp. M7H15-1 TaxID=2501295 RepID=UPI001004EEC1|nr:hypothetical protein [Dyella sp. M7H15-1]QAU22860.1 hypothetical protein EO087_01715 [Dyella sp. M7H15-1]